MEPEFNSQYFSPDAKSLLKGLLCKNHRMRLGANGIHEIKQHPWFDPIDFGLLEAGYLDPPFKPSLDEIHAENQQHIGRPPQDGKYDRIKLKPEFEKSLENFPFVSKTVVQQEIVEVLEKASADRRHSDADPNVPFDFTNAQPNHSSESCLSACLIV